MKKSAFLFSLLLLGSSTLLNGCRSLSLSNENLQEEGTVIAETSYGHPPQHIALLLPLSGKHAEAAQAIKEGYLASYYHSNQDPKPTVQVYDTAKGGDVQKVYEQAVKNGADFVVGPLTKEEVQRLGALSSSQFKTPILALNKPANQSYRSQLYQFSLTPEAEAAQIVQKAWQKGYKTASIITPNNTWGKRMNASFVQQWQQQGGRVLRTVYANPDYDQSAAIRNLLGIDEKQKKAIEERKLDAQAIQPHFVDVIFMAAPPEQARQLKPLFDFYYADDIPIYATSSVYTGQINPTRDRDLNGIIFCDMPCLLDPHKQAQLYPLLGSKSTKSGEYKRLFSMGVDAYNVSIRLPALRAGKRYAGATGHLVLQHNNIQRTLACAKMKGGIPVME